jgi:hypothetical protein
VWKPQISYIENVGYSTVQDERYIMNGAIYEELLKLTVEHAADFVANLEGLETRYVLKLGRFTLHINYILYVRFEVSMLVNVRINFMYIEGKVVPVLK